MTEKKRNLIVALFVILGLAAMGWMIFKFGDLPVLVSRYDARTIEIFFPEAPGIQENSQVLFRGYPVGRVVRVHPPHRLKDLDDPQIETYQLIVEVSISRNYDIPQNAVPKVYSRGLGSSFLEFVLSPGEPPSDKLIVDGDRMKGRVSEASEFLSEKTQKKLDDLIASLTSLSDELRGQLTTVAPEQVDQSPDTIQPNITTAVIRLDRVLKNLNEIVDDPENRNNIKTSLSEFAALTKEMRQVAAQTQLLASKAQTLLDHSANSIKSIDAAVAKSSDNFEQIGIAMQNVADQLALTMKHMDDILIAMSQGTGTAGRLLNDPRLYESLTDATENLKITLQDFRELILKWKEKGVLAK